MKTKTANSSLRKEDPSVYYLGGKPHWAESTKYHGLIRDLQIFKKALSVADLQSVRGISILNRDGELRTIFNT